MWGTQVQLGICGLSLSPCTSPSLSVSDSSCFPFTLCGTFLATANYRQHISSHLALLHSVPVCLTLQPLKLHALALAIIEARHQSLMGQATRPTCNCGNTIANCTGQLPGQLLSWPGKWSSLQLETAKTSLHQRN